MFLIARTSPAAKPTHKFNTWESATEAGFLKYRILAALNTSEIYEGFYWTGRAEGARPYNSIIGVRKHGERRKSPTVCPIVSYDENDIEHGFYQSIASVAKDGYNVNKVRYCLAHPERRHRGLYWRYFEIERTVDPVLPRKRREPRAPRRPFVAINKRGVIEHVFQTIRQATEHPNHYGQSQLSVLLRLSEDYPTEPLMWKRHKDLRWRYARNGEQEGTQT